MKIEKVRIIGFRNFIDTTVNFTDKNLIIGKNDVGKSNLLYALRILFDKSLSTNDLELTDSDYCIYSENKYIEITAYLSDVVEDCLISESAFKGCLDDNNNTIVRYLKRLEDESFKIYIGSSEEVLTEYTDRKYIRRLNLHYVESQRDLFFFYKTEKRKLLQSSILNLTEEDLEADKKKKEEMKESLISLNKKVNDLKYISNALNDVNSVLKDISSSSDYLDVKFTSVEQDVDKMLSKIELCNFNKNQAITVGGDGRNNQIYMATWLAKEKIEKTDSCVTLLAIEEPECHLHPQQQRYLARFLMNYSDTQIFLTSHSPQITASVNPNMLIKLSKCENNVIKSFDSNNKSFVETLDKFNFRLNAISSELFYCDAVLLVEGVSEVLFYKKYCESNDLQLDKNNFCIISVEGVGFKPYIELCLKLGIPYVIKTDNDVFDDQNDCNVRKMAGLSRAIDFLKMQNNNSAQDVLKKYNDNSGLFKWDISKDDSREKRESLFNEISKDLEKNNIFLSCVDLETDIANSELKEWLIKFYNCSKQNLVKTMKKRKAENMYNLINDENATEEFSKIRKHSLVAPILTLLSFIKNYEDTNK